MVKKIFLFLLAAFVIIQFFRPNKNISEEPQPNTLANKYEIPEEVHVILKKACLDCHSNNTKYPWYYNVQPLAWWLNYHITDGKKNFNLDEYTHRRPRYKYHKMEEVIEMVDEGEMPLNSYTWVHKDAKLSKAEKDKLTAWARSIMEILKTEYPIDSLVSKK
jgi:uncharacterized membrane protein YgaE (UPF0421/DUF939 family)